MLFFLTDFQPKASTSKKKSKERKKGQNLDVEEICEFCSKYLTQSTILRHIGQSEACKAFYGSRFEKMKKKKISKRKFIYRKSLGMS